MAIWGQFTKYTMSASIAFLEFFYLLIWPPLFYQKHAEKRQMAIVIGFWLWSVIFFITLGSVEKFI